MPRTHKPLDPDGGPLADFARDLRLLRERAGSTPYRALAKRAGFSASTLSVAASGTRLPSLDVTLAYVQACGADPEPWRLRWQQLAAARQPVGVSQPRSAAAGQYERARERTGPALPRAAALGRRWRLAVAVLAMFGGAVIAAVYLAGKPAGRAAIGAPAKSEAYPYDQTVGPGCPQDQSAAIGEDNSGPGHSWTTATAMNWAVPRCRNLILYSQPTTERSPAHWQNDYFWMFSKIPVGDRCTFRIYIPDSAYSRYVAAYDWSTSTSYLEQTAFVIRQDTYRGRWYLRGPVTISGGTAVMILTDARSDVPAGPLTAGAVRLTCR